MIGWKTPAGDFPRLYSEMLEQVHLLIAGATGSGKSTVVNGIIYTALYRSPGRMQFIFLDPKGCELDEYRRLPHCIAYAHTPSEITHALHEALGLVSRRLREMKRRGLRMYEGADVYIVIDELMVIMSRPEMRKTCFPVLQEILAIARAARVHVIACTQSPIARVIPTELKCNFDSRLGLRTASAQDSRNILGVKGCERFPNPSEAGRALGYWMRGADMELWELPRVKDDERARLVRWWMKHRRHGWHWKG